MMTLSLFSFIEAAVLLLIVILVVALIVRVMVKGSGKLTNITINQLVKQECASSGTNNGAFDVELGTISQGVLDILTQGYSLDQVSAKVKWRRFGRGCRYTIIVNITDSDDTVTRESEEFTVEPCP